MASKYHVGFLLHDVYEGRQQTNKFVTESTMDCVYREKTSFMNLLTASSTVNLQCILKAFLLVNKRSEAIPTPGSKLFQQIG